MRGHGKQIVPSPPSGQTPPAEAWASGAARGCGHSPCSILALLPCSVLSPGRHELLSLMEPSRVGVSTQALPLALRVPGCLSPLLSWGATHSTPCQPLTCPACPLSSSLRKWQLHPLNQKPGLSPQQALPQHPPVPEVGTSTSRVPPGSTPCHPAPQPPSDPSCHQLLPGRLPSPPHWAPCSHSSLHAESGENKSHQA